MKVLLDTHVFLWMSGNFEKISTKVQEIILEMNNDVFVSFVSAWEMQIKLKLVNFAWISLYRT